MLKGEGGRTSNGFGVLVSPENGGSWGYWLAGAEGNDETDEREGKRVLMSSGGVGDVLVRFGRRSSFLCLQTSRADRRRALARDGVASVLRLSPRGLLIFVRGTGLGRSTNFRDEASESP